MKKQPQVEPEEVHESLKRKEKNMNMTQTQQRLKSIEIDGLRRLKNLSISFEDKNVTGIFGPNGSGKTTLLYTLLCLYKSQSSKKQYNFGAFFKRCKDNEFDNTKITASVHYRNGRNEKDVSVIYEKSRGSDRWTPKTSRRPERDVFFFGINNCVPTIEEEIKITKKYSFVPGAIISDEVKNDASNILGINYSMISHEKKGNKEYYHATRKDGSEYYSVSMGAGEQRVLKILEFLENIPDYSLIIIDEIDLTLHTAALNKLIDFLVNKAEKHHYQIVFTSHREELIDRKDINIRHLYQTDTATFCFNETRPDCIDRLTGGTVQELEIYVEDDLSKTIIAQCAKDLEIRKRVKIRKFGACTNAFVLASALYIKEKNLSSQLFVLDGDLYKDDIERLDQIKKYLSGTEPEREEDRKNVLESIKSLNLPDNYSPEKYINEIIGKSIETSDTELVKAANSIIQPQEQHDYINKIIEQYEDEKSIGYYNVIQEMKKHPEWIDYTKQVNEWLEQKKKDLHLNPVL